MESNIRTVGFSETLHFLWGSKVLVWHHCHHVVASFLTRRQDLCCFFPRDFTFSVVKRIAWCYGSRSCHLVQKPPALGVVLVGSEVVASHPRARLEPSTFFPRVENPDLANEMGSSANADDFTRSPKHVEAEVANLKFSG